MKSVIASLVAVAGLSVAASAAVNTQLEYLVSVDGGPFTHSANILAGTGSHTVEVVARVSYTGTAQPLGLSSLVFQPTVSNFGIAPGGARADAALAFHNGGMGGNTSTPIGTVADAPGQYGRMTPWGRTATLSATAHTAFVHNAGTGGAPAGRWLRISQRNATNWVGVGPTTAPGSANNFSGGAGVQIAQLSSASPFRTSADPAYNPNLSVNVFRWGMTIDSGAFEASSVRTLEITTPAAGFGNLVTTANTAFPDSQVGDREAYWYATTTENSGSIRGTIASGTSFINIVIPSPASLALLGLGGLCVARRRR